MKNGPRLAIDFGTTRTKVAYYDASREEARLIELGISQREIIPSVFYVPKRNAGEILVGDDATAQIDIDPAGIVREIKREIDKLGKKRCGAGRLAPTRVELAAELLRTVRRRCEEGVFHGQMIDKCTLTVPVSFTESQRTKLVEAANLAGFKDVRLMDEPTAAARAWVEKQGERFGDHVVVVDIGGGTTDFSVVEWSNDRFAPHSSVLPEGFAQGGNDIDDHACDEILAQQKVEDEESVLRIKDSFLVKLRSIKEQFTRGLKRQSIVVGSAKIEIQPAVFRAAETEFVNRLCDELQTFFEKCRQSGIESPVVLVVGGASRIAGIIDMLTEICPREVFTWESADFATVLGAVEYPGNETGFESAKQRKAQANYIEALKVAIADDQVTVAEAMYLRSRREQLCLSESVYSSLELDVLGEVLDQITVVDENQVRVDPADPDVIAAVKSAIHEGNFDAALDQLQISLDESPNVPEYLLLKASAYLRQKRYPLGISSATAALKLAPGENRARFVRGVCYFHQRNFEDAKQDLSACLNTKRHKEQSQFLLCAIDSQQGCFGNVSERLDEFANGDGHRSEAIRFIQAFERLTLRQGQAAVTTIERLITAIVTRGGEIAQSTINSLQLFFGERFPVFLDQFIGTWENKSDSLLNDKSIVCPSCGFYSSFDGSYCSHCKKSASGPVNARVQGNQKGVTLKLLANRLFESHQLVTRDPGELARAYVRSCVRCGLSPRWIEEFKDKVHLDSALSETALLSSKFNVVSGEDLRDLLLTLLSSTKVDVVQLRREKNIKTVGFLVDLLKPKLRLEEEHGNVFNHIRITNDSIFSVSDIRVVASIIRSDGSHYRGSVTLSKLGSGETHEWPNIFKDPGWFGSNIKSVALKVTCNED